MSKLKDEKTTNTATANTRPSPAQAPPPPPGLDVGKHAKAQRSAAKADMIRSGRLFAAYALTVIGANKFDIDDIQAYIDGLVRDLGNTNDPLQRILLEQLTLIHFRLVKLQGDAFEVKSTEALKIYNAGCARLLAELRRLVLTIDVLRGKVTATPNLKLAQTA